MLKDTMKQLRESKKMTAKAVAEAIGILPDTYRCYEQGRREPNLETLKLIADYFCVTTDYLLGRPEAKPPVNPIDDFAKKTKMPSTEKAALAKWLSLDSTKRQAVLDIMAAIVHEYEMAEKQHEKPPIFVIRRHINKASAGIGYDLENDDNWTDIKVVDCPEAHEADFVVEVDGNSMEPTYHDGDIVFVKLSAEIPLNQIGLFRKGEQGYIKRRGKDRLISDNPNYDDIYPAEGAPIECIGHVIGIAESLE